MRLRVVTLFVPAASLLALSLLLVGSAGCAKKKEKVEIPVFRLTWSAYPSWSVFGVAAELGLIDGAEGKQGTLEKKWGVDIVLERLEYEPSIQAYTSKTCDAVCATNIDILAPAATRQSVAILPTSTSAGADACLVVGIDVSDKKMALLELRKHKVYGLGRSVSEYTFERNLQLLGEDPKKYKFTDEPPKLAAQAMQAKKPDHNAIVVWNPLVLQVLKENKDAKRLFDSSSIPEEIIDMVVVAQESLDREKGQDFACCIIDVYYAMNKKLQDADSKNADEVLLKLGEKFSKLKLEELRTIVKESRFCKNPAEGLALFNGKKLPETMKIVSQFCLDKEMIKKKVSYGFGTKNKAGDVQLRFDPSWIEQVRDRE